jgi:hypothetical protein
VVTTLDGSGQPEEISARLATDVWSALAPPQAAPQAVPSQAAAEESSPDEAGKESSGTAVLG